MAQLCPSCNKFAGLEMQDPEVNSVEFDTDSMTVSAEVRIVRNSSCCGDEMKEYTFNTDMELSDELQAKIKAAMEANPEIEVEAQEGSCDVLEEGGSRYAKSYYGYTLSVDIMVDGKAMESVDMTDKIDASSMDELT